MLPEAATFFGLDEGAAVASAAAPNDPLNDTGTWRILGGSVEVRSSGQLVELPRATLSPKAARNGD